jgi:hypothetical protein
MAMNKRLSKKQMWFKQIKPTEDDKIYVGIDVHKESCSVAIWLNDAPAIDFVTPTTKSSPRPSKNCVPP